LGYHCRIANQPPATAGNDEVRMLQGFLQTLAKIAVASLIVGTILAHFGITADVLAKEVGFSPDRIEDLVRRGITWALPNLLLGLLIIVPLWCLAFIFRPPGRSSE
jgi:ABC-type arginine transport system permease subunit